MTNTFLNCKLIQKIQDNAKLPSGIISTQGMFEGCTSLKSIPSVFFENLQYVNGVSIDVSKMFYNCSTLTSNILVASEYLWNNKRIQFNSLKTFNNANKLAGYDKIPDTWK
jgi:hypothetical protein